MEPMQDERATLGPRAIWAPWRLAYLEGTIAPVGTSPGAAEPRAEPGAKTVASERSASAAVSGAVDPAAASSFLERYWLSPDADLEHHVIVRTADGLILLNAFPYSNGHLLVALGEPRARLLDYEASQRAALWGLVDIAMDLMERVLEPQGVNVGINQGRAAGAGVPGHLHVHLVPRWSGDVNFMTAVGQIRVVPSSLEQMGERYRAALRPD